MTAARRVPVVVVGGGPAGLATSRELKVRGVEHVVLERTAAVGDLWASLYDGLRLHSGRRHSALPGKPFPQGTPTFPTRDDVVAYLRAYQRDHALPVECGVEVKRAHRSDGPWTVETSRGDFRCELLVMATGLMANPIRPALPGLDEFAGRVVHSIEYRSPAPYVGRRVLVVGCGNSGADVAAETAAAGAASVDVSIRSGVDVFPLTVAGIPTQYLIIHLGNNLPEKAWNALVDGFGRVGKLLGDVPALPPAKAAGGTPVFGDAIVRAVRAGKVRVRPAIERFFADRVRFVDGDEVALDDVVLATGFTAAVGVLDRPVTLTDHKFRNPKCVDDVVSVDDDRLLFVGYNYAPPGGLYRIHRDAPRAAERAARVVGVAGRREASGVS